MAKAKTPEQLTKAAKTSIKNLLADLEDVAKKDRPTVLAGWMVGQLTALEGADLEAVKTAFLSADLQLKKEGQKKA